MDDLPRIEEVLRKIVLNRQVLFLLREEIREQKNVDKNLKGIRRHKQALLELDGELRRINGNQTLLRT